MPTLDTTFGDARRLFPGKGAAHPDSRAAMEAIHRRYRAILRERAEPYLAGRMGVRRQLRAHVLWRIGPVQRALRYLRHRMRAHPRPLRQLVQLPWFAAAYRVDPESYYRHRLDRNWQRRNDFIFHDEIVAVLEDLNIRLSPRDTDDLYDKRRFHERCAAAGLPTIPVLASFEDGRITEVDARPESAECDLFSKFATRWCGEGASLWRFVNGRYESEGRSFDLAQLKAHLAELSLTFPVLLQPKISNARALAPIAGKGVSTVRIITVRRGQSTLEAALAVYRMATGEQIADNFAAGGMAAPVALDSGALGTATLMKIGGDEPIACHPDTGQRLDGFVLPHWEAAKALAVAAHRAFPSMVSVGWDVAITDDGPLVVEGNAVWGVHLAQIPHGRPLADSIIPEAIAGHLAALG